MIDREYNTQEEMDELAATNPQEQISLCNSCNCMTHTLNGCCGKCGAVKPEEQDEQANFAVHYQAVQKK